MPEFHLNIPPQHTVPNARNHPYFALSDFAKGYVEAMFFTNGDTGDDNEDILNDLGVEKLTAKAVKAIAADCDRFLGTIMPDGCFVRQWLDRAQALEPGSPEFKYAREALDDRRCGHLFWYARQGHGVAWTDDGNAEYLHGLQEACRKFGEAYPEVSRGWIHYR